MNARCAILALAACIGTANSAAAQAHLDRSTLRATFSDDFTHFSASATGDAADGRPAWRTTFIDGERTLANNHEAEWYEDAGPAGPFRATAGLLKISASPQAGLPRGMAFRSGLLTSQKLHGQLYGHFEMRAQLPHGQGLWPAFWLLPIDGSWPPEIDVMEMLGHAPQTYYVSLHAHPQGRNVDEVTAIQSPDLSTGFHVFGVSWRYDRIQFYLDDTLVHESATPADMHRPMYMLANLAVGGVGSWPGPAAPDVSGIYRIAWIRAWQFGDNGTPAR